MVWCEGLHLGLCQSHDRGRGQRATRVLARVPTCVVVRMFCSSVHASPCMSALPSSETALFYHSFLVFS